MSVSYEGLTTSQVEADQLSSDSEGSTGSYELTEEDLALVGLGPLSFKPPSESEESTNSYNSNEGTVDPRPEGNDEHSLFIPVAEGMVNQVYRFGILPKKTLEHDGHHIRGRRNHWRDDRSTTPDGSIIIHENDIDPNVDACPAFIHPPYGSQIEYRQEQGREYSATTTLEAVTKAAEVCGFCSVIHQGVQSMRDEWIIRWAEHIWLDSCSERPSVQHLEEQPWLLQFEDEIQGRKQIDERDITLFFRFPVGNPYVSVEVQLDPGARTSSKRYRTLETVEFYTEPDSPSPWAIFGTSNHIADDLLSNDSISQMLGWIRNCQRNHPACMSQVTADNPTRLLRIGRPTGAAGSDGCVPLEINLEITEKHRNYSYIAVSHCWANSEPLKTNAINIDAHLKQIPWKDLSASFREVAVLTYVLGYDYLWIDSLCIIQEDRADWDHEAPRMGMIYRNAIVVFALLGPTLSFEKDFTRLIQDRLHPDDPPVYCRGLMNHRPVSAPPVHMHRQSWFARAWCMQERINASRMIYFGGTREEMIFECSAAITCECGRIKEEQALKKQFSTSLHNALDYKGTISKQALWDVYIKFCEDYSARALTVPTDRLPAITSIMQFFAPHFGKYYAGLWEYNFVIGLQWEAWNTCICSRHEAYVAPSFSWAARDGPVIWYYHSNDMPSEETHEFCKVIDVSCTVETVPLGMVTDGYMKLQCRYALMEIVDRAGHAPDGRLEIVKSDTESCYVTIDSIEDWESLQAGSLITCIDVMRDREGEYVSALALLPVRRDDTEEVYRRIGFSTMKKLHFDDDGSKDFMIV